MCVDLVDLDTLEAFLLAGVREASPPRAGADRQTLAGGLHQALHLLPHQGGETQAPLGDQPPHLHLDGEEVLVPGVRHGHVQPLGQFEHVLHVVAAGTRACNNLRIIFSYN